MNNPAKPTQNISSAYSEYAIAERGRPYKKNYLLKVAPDIRGKLYRGNDVHVYSD